MSAEYFIEVVLRPAVATLKNLSKWFTLMSVEKDTAVGKKAMGENIRPTRIFERRRVLPRDLIDRLLNRLDRCPHKFWAEAVSTAAYLRKQSKE